MNYMDILSAPMNATLAAMGFEKPTPIQEQTIPAILEGRDAIGQAQTGTGKTAAFAVPMLERIDLKDDRIQALVLAPTRELAQQITEQVIKLSAHMEGFRVMSMYGGTAMGPQNAKLAAGVHMVVGTPGRVLDHLRRRSMRVFGVRMVTLDEADEMLDMGFREDIEEILSYTSSKRQTLMFSATMPPPILELTKQYLNEPLFVGIEIKRPVVDTIEQSYVDTTEQTKSADLADLILQHKPGLALVFCNTKLKVDQLVGKLKRKGIRAEGIHGDMEQYRRDMILARFKERALNVLVATDVASRGLDISGVDMVFNYDVPKNAEHYVHRIGRTGRMGKSGKAITLVEKKDARTMSRIQHHTKVMMANEKGDMAAPQAQNEPKAQTQQQNPPTDKPKAKRRRPRRKPKAQQQSEQA